ncbi:MAG: bifunctional metallophosphatase/5'-nucleotidase [Spirochaetes bacterium]|nr:bifunctional metallophosphatase/5'-nucleotidase [Spirochaetota bacterium]MBU0954542.1 bifunctional metallophosphatase/5'-nucleotidase [Spirochaetota bacterium]
MKSIRKVKGIMSFALVLVLAFGLLACVSAPVETPAPEPRVPASGTFTLLHTNDMHGRVLTGAYDGMGLDRVAAVANQFRGEGKNVLLLDAGDALHGLPMVTLDSGAPMVRLMNAIGYEAMSPGNHDFNYGQARLVELADMADFAILAANVTDKASGEYILPPYIIKDIGGLKVGIFGLSTPETYYTSHPDNTANLKLDYPIVAASKMVKLLRPQVDVLIALAHLGTGGDYSSFELAKVISGIDIIVDGHSHTLLPNGEVVGSTLIVQAGEYNKNVGVVDVMVDNGVVSLTAGMFSKEDAMKLPADPAVEAMVKEIDAANKAILDEKIGVAAVDLNGERAVVRTQESAFVNMILDIFLAETGADLAFTNGGGIRTSVKAGDVTYGHIINVMPFGNRIVTLNVKGSDIVAALEVGAARYPDQNGALLHVGGMSYVIDPSRAAGSRVNPAKVLVGGQPIDLEKVYLVATNDFLKAGGDGMTMLKAYPVVTDVKDQALAVADYLRTNSPVNPKLEGRITIGTW